MIELSADTYRALVAEANLAPSVHNVQPTRFRLERGAITLLGDMARAIPVADPHGRDWRISHGTACEGLALALGQRGIAAEVEITAPQLHENSQLVPIARAFLRPLAGVADKEPVEARMSWRGDFGPHDEDVAASLDRLAEERTDLLLIRDPAGIRFAADLADKAGLHFLRDTEHRRELLQWMRLSHRNPDYDRDGLNAEAMRLGAVEAWGAGQVLGPLFPALDRLGLAHMLISERSKVISSAAIGLFHRPAGEDAFDTGRAMYRAWLAIERAGLKAVPMSVLADWDTSNQALASRHGIGSNRIIMNALRMGKASNASARRARLPVSELIVQASR